MLMSLLRQVCHAHVFATSGVSRSCLCYVRCVMLMSLLRHARHTHVANTSRASRSSDFPRAVIHDLFGFGVERRLRLCSRFDLIIIGSSFEDHR